MLESIITILVFIIFAIGLAGIWIFATTMKMDYKDDKGNYIVKK
jgi:uncharacterized membrane protein YuzA (DUF378 family)